MTIKQLQLLQCKISGLFPLDVKPGDYIRTETKRKSIVTYFYKSSKGDIRYLTGEKAPQSKINKMINLYFTRKTTIEVIANDT